MSSILDRKTEKKPKDVDASFGSGGLFTSSSQEQRRYDGEGGRGVVGREGEGRRDEVGFWRRGLSR
jgi:hypothetical protein